MTEKRDASAPVGEGAASASDEPVGDEANVIDDWGEAVAAMEKHEQRRETRRYRTDDGVVAFTIRPLTQEQRDEVERAAAGEASKAEQRSRSGQGVDLDRMDMWPVKRAQLQHGIVDGPSGFDPEREEHLRQLPGYVQDDLFEAIDALGELETEVKEGFTDGAGGSR